jgi:hypothetical protein
MKVNVLSGFAAGIFITTSICSAVYYSSNHQVSKKVDKVQLSETEMKDKLVAAGYVFEKKADTAKKKTVAAKNPTPATKKSAPAETKPAVKQVVVNVTLGMTSIDVGQVLANEKLITQSPFQFSKEIEKRDMQKLLKPGSYTVNSEMSYDEIIDTIFKK